MYISKYYNCEEIDQRLLQGYYDDFVTAGFVGSKEEFWAFVLSIAECVKKEDGKGLSSNDFTDELLNKLNSIEEGAKAITKVSQLENDLKYQTEEQVKATIDSLINGASDALDTLKELEDALGGDPNFANTVTNKLTDISNKLTEEIARAKQVEQDLTSAIESLDNKVDTNHQTVLNKIDTVEDSLDAKIEAVNNKTIENKQAIESLRSSISEKTSEAKEYARDLVDQEKTRAMLAEKQNADNIHALENTHTLDKAELENKITNEAAERRTKDQALENAIALEEEDRKSKDTALQTAIDKEIQDRRDDDEALSQQFQTKIESASTQLESKISQEAQERRDADTILQTALSNEKIERQTQDAILEHKIDDLDNKIDTQLDIVKESLRQEKVERQEAITDLDNRKVDKEEGKGLSSNDFTNELKRKLESIDEGALKIERTSQLINDSDFQTSAQVRAMLDELIDGAPDALNTLRELAEAIGDDRDFAATITRKITTLTEQLNAEKELRASEDALIKEQLNAEKERAQGVENQLSSTLATEINERRAADAEIRETVNNNKAEQATINSEFRTDIIDIRNNIRVNNSDLLEKIQTNTAAIQRNLELIQHWQGIITSIRTDLEAAIAKEIQDRTDADDLLRQQLVEAVDDYTQKINDLRDSLERALETERNERRYADNVLQQNIDQVSTALETEKTEREAQDRIIQQNIENEAQARETADNLLQQKLDQEIQDRKDADDLLRQAIEAEKTAREAADEAEKTARETADQGLQEQITNNKNDLIQEIQDRKDADIELSNQITLEKNQRETADQNLQNQIDSLDIKIEAIKAIPDDDISQAFIEVFGS